MLDSKAQLADYCAWAIIFQILVSNSTKTTQNIPIWETSNSYFESADSFRDGGRAALCCGRCVGSCCWSWSPSCRTPAVHSCQWTVAWRRRASPSTPASGRSTWSRPALCCASTAPWWASQVSGWSPAMQKWPCFHIWHPYWFQSEAPVARSPTDPKPLIGLWSRWDGSIRLWPPVICIVASTVVIF